MLDADGNGVERLTNDPTRDFTPNWSPDGSRIVFVRQPGEIWVVNADGSGLTQLTDPVFSDESPAFSPDGTKIAFTRVTAQGDSPFNTELFVMNADGSNAVMVTNTPPTSCGGDAYRERDPDWQPLPFKNASKKCKAFPGQYRNHGRCVKASH